MNKRNACSACTITRFRIDHTNAFCLKVSNGCFDVINTKSDMLDAAAAIVLGNELSDRAVISSSFEKLDFTAVRCRVEARYRPRP